MFPKIDNSSDKQQQKLRTWRGDFHIDDSSNKEITTSQKSPSFWGLNQQSKSEKTQKQVTG